MLRHLDLFSGIGGFALAARMVSGIETSQFVEINPYCQRVLAKNFPGVPIHGDIKTYSAQPGDFDLLTAGFPCQPHSQAGKRKASKDDRDLWPELYRIICEVQPRWCVFENVVGLLSSESGRFFRGILWDLAKAGFNAEWAVVSAADLGAAHRRERVWIVAYSNGIRRQQSPPWKSLCDKQRNGEASEQSRQAELHAPLSGGATSAHSASPRRNEGVRSPGQRPEELADEPQRSLSSAGNNAPNSNSARLATWKLPAIGESAIVQLKRLDGRDGRGFTTEPLLRRGNDGLRNRMDRIRGLGNAVAPQVAAIALQRVLELAEVN